MLRAENLYSVFHITSWLANVISPARGHASHCAAVGGVSHAPFDRQTNIWTGLQNLQQTSIIVLIISDHIAKEPVDSKTQCPHNHGTERKTSKDPTQGNMGPLGQHGKPWSTSDGADGMVRIFLAPCLLGSAEGGPHLPHHHLEVHGDEDLRM